MTIQPARFQHPGALKEAQRLIKEALNTGASNLDLSGLRLRYLPEELKLLSKQLTNLNLSRCTVLTSIAGIEQLTAITSLDMSRCEALTSVADIKHLKELDSLNISGCQELTSLAGITQLTALNSLNISSCQILTSLASIEQLTALNSLNISYCLALTSLAGIEHLSALTSLNMSSCQGLTSLIGIERLIALTSLDISNCERLTSLAGIEQLTAITSLDMSSCEALTSLAEIEPLTTLTSLNISYNLALTSLAGIKQLTTLNSLNMRGCRSLSSLSGIEQLTLLTSLNISYCPALTSIADINQMTALTSLNISYHQGLTSLSSINRLIALTSLNVGSCKALTNLTGIEQLTALTSLDASNCESLNSLAGIEQLRALTTLNISECNALSCLAGIEQLKMLTSLSISGGSALTNLADIEALTTLTSLDVDNFEALTSLTNIKNLTALTSLVVGSCHSLNNLAGIEQLTELTTLEIFDCPALNDINGVEHLIKLTELGLYECPAFNSLEGVEQLHSLILLWVIDCENLTHFTDIEKLRSLQTLGIDSANIIFPLQTAKLCLLEFPRLTVYAEENGIKIEHVPPELTRNFNQTAFEDWWFACQPDNFAPVKQLKVMLLGNGRIGKTQLARRLRNETFDSNVPSTHGIQLHTVSWTQLFGGHGSLPPAIDPAYADIQLHCWDFGGQDVYLGTHSLFLDHQAVYILLWHPEAENNDEVDCEMLRIRNRPLSYWLAYLKSLAGDNANILVCQSQCDEPTQHRNAPVPNPPPFKALRQLDISSKTGDGLEQFYPTFKKALQQQLCSNGEIWLPNSWLAVEQDIRQLVTEKPELKQLSYENFVTLCHRHQVTAPATLANYLHQSGALFYRPGHFNNQLILDQQWALQGVYLLLERDYVLPQLQAGQGLFDAAMLQRWLEKQQLNTADLSLFLEMMQQCGACFQVTATNFIAPDNLPEFDKNKAIQIWHDVEPDIYIELSYIFLHDATMRYLLSKIGEVAKEHAYYWRYGCCFYDQKHKTKVWFECQLPPLSAEHQQNYSQPGVIKLRFTGQQCAELAQHLVKSITQSSHLGQLPDVNWLKGQPVKSTDDKVEHDSPKPFSAIGPAALPPKTPAIYFSYAWGTEQDPRQQVCDEVYQSLKTEGYLVQRDKEATDIGASIAEFERSIGRGDFVLVVLSHKYLFESFHCMKELAFLYESSQRQQTEFTHRIIPILLSDVRIDRPVDRLKIAKHWQEQHTELNNLVNEVGAEVAGASSALELEQMRSIVNCCVNALAWISDLITERQSELQVDATVTLVKTKVAIWAEKH